MLKIKGSDGRYSMVCADRWNQNHSDTVCKELGFTKAIRWPQIHLAQPNMQFYKMREENLSTNFIANLNLSNSCDEGIVSLECQTYCEYIFSVSTKIEYIV